MITSHPGAFAAPEILQARTAALLSGKPLPAPVPAVAENVRMDIAPRDGLASLVNDDGKVRVEYIPAGVAGEMRDFFQYAYEAENRVWIVKVQIQRIDSGSINNTAWKPIR